MPPRPKNILAGGWEGLEARREDCHGHSYRSPGEFLTLTLTLTLTRALTLTLTLTLTRTRTQTQTQTLTLTLTLVIDYNNISFF